MTLKKICILLVTISNVAFFVLGCSTNKPSNDNEKNIEVSKSVVSESAANESGKTKESKEVKVSKPNEGGLKQELNTKAAVSTTDKNQITFEVPANQLQGLKVGDSLVINNGNNAYPAQIVTVPPINTTPQNPPNVIGNPNSASKVIITAQVGPGINLPYNRNDYTVTYLYNNRDPHSYYINKNYVYYDEDRAYVYVTGPDRVIRRKYIRTGLINRYYAELLDQFDAAERIVEAYKDYYIENVVVPEIIEDYTNQVINDYQDYIDSLNQRWNYVDDVNTITIDVNDVDWNKLEEQDTILTDQDMTEIYEEIQTNHIDDTDSTIDPSYDSNDSISNDSDSSENTSYDTSSDRDSNDNVSSEETSDENTSDDNTLDESTFTEYTINDSTSYDSTSNDNSLDDDISNDNTLSDSASSDNTSDDSDSNDSSDNYDSFSNNDSGEDNSSDFSYETTTILVDDDN